MVTCIPQPRLTQLRRQRPPPSQHTSGRRQPTQPTGSNRQPLIGGVLTLSLQELAEVEDVGTSMLRTLVLGDTTTAERIVPLGLIVKWEVGEAGVCSGLKVGDVMDTSQLQPVSRVHTCGSEL
jgi:hypothetical protein